MVEQIKITKRDGSKQTVQFDKITKRLGKLCDQHNIKCMYTSIAKNTIEGLYDGIKTSELDILAAETSAYMCLRSSEYDRLASALIVSNLHKETKTFIECSAQLHDSGSLSDIQWCLVCKHGRMLEKAIDYNRDYDYDYSGIRTMLSVSLARVGEKTVERPQCMYMRIALALYADDIESVLDCYELMSKKMCIHGTPTQLNAGMNNRLSSCFLLTTEDKDGIDSIYKTIRDCAIISSTAGGIGFSISNIPSAGSPDPKGGIAPGIVPMLRVFNETLRYAKQGGGRRQGAFAAYLEPWHSDIEVFVDLKLPTEGTIEEMRCKSLFLGIWMCDLFMKRVRNKETWSLFSPSTAPGLNECWGEEFEELYAKYEKEGRAIKTVSAVGLWLHIMKSGCESGVPYILMKDRCNEYSNQRHLGCIKSSNLCTEIIQYSSDTETAVCNLASVSLPTCIVNNEFSHLILFRIVQRLTKNLNKVIDICNYPTDEARNSNMKHRPIGIGVSGFADTCMELRMPFGCARSRQLNIEIFETIYYAFMRTSCDLAKIYGSYASYEGSFVSKGILNYMLYNDTVTDRWPFESLSNDIAKYGNRNSLGTCVMPTSTGSIIHGNNESVEPFISNIFIRKVIAGEHIVINKHLETELKRLNLWNHSIKAQILKNDGSVANIMEIPEEVRELYKTIWEIGSKTLIEMSADRAPFIDQSQSLNLYIEKPTIKLASDMIFYGWKLNLKTCMYYLRSKAATNPALLSIQSCLNCSG